MKTWVKTGRCMQNIYPFSTFRRLLPEKLPLLLDFANSCLRLKNYPFFRESGYERGIGSGGSGRDVFKHMFWTKSSSLCWCKLHLNRHQTILHTFSQLFLNSTLSGVPHLYRQLPNGQYLSDLCKMCNLEANLRKMWTDDHRILTYIFKWERLNTAGHSHTVSIGHWVAPLYND